MFTRFRTVTLAAVLAAAALGGPAAAQQSEEPLARFEDPLCPGIVGLQVEAAEFLVGRIRSNAEALGLRLADERTCEPNVVVMFVKSGQGYFERLRDDRPFLFRDLTLAERDELFGDDRPARALLRVIPRSRDGMPIPRREDLIAPPQTTMWMAHSKIYTATRNDIYHALVLFDRDAVKGMTVNQLADYVTFRALSRTLPTESSVGANASVLTLFNAGAQVDGLTEFDRAWLAALYRGPPNLPAPARLAELEKATGWKGPVDQ
jgi:hypothetical protein